jgi:hypothetical protein
MGLLDQIRAARQVFKKLWTKSEPLRARPLAAFRPDEVTALLGLLRRVAEVMAPPASNDSRTTTIAYLPAGNMVERKGRQ